MRDTPHGGCEPHPCLSHRSRPSAPPALLSAGQPFQHIAFPTQPERIPAALVQARMRAAFTTLSAVPQSKLDSRGLLAAYPLSRVIVRVYLVVEPSSAVTVTVMVFAPSTKATSTPSAVASSSSPGVTATVA